MPHPKGYFDRTQKLHTIEQTMARLQELTGAKKPEQVYRDEPNRPAREITQTVQLPQGYKPEPVALEWDKPVRWADGSGYVRSLEGQFSVVKERSGEGWRYVAFHGINALGASNGAETAKDLCQTHFARACGADNGT